MQKLSKKIVFLIALVSILALALLVWWWNKDNNKTTYLTETVKIGNIEYKIPAVGTLEATDLVSVGSQASGEIIALNVKVGDKVKQGDVIAQIDSTTQNNAVLIAQAKLQSTQNKVTSLNTQLTVALANFEREKALLAVNATSQFEFENAKKELALTKSSLAEAQANLSEVKLTLSNAQKDLRYTQIISPSDGTVLSVLVSKGQTVNAQQNTPNIIKIADLQQMKLKLKISEGDIANIKPGLEVEYYILSDPKSKYSTTLESIDYGTTDITDDSDTSSSNTSGRVTSNTIFYYGNALVDNENNLFRIGMTINSNILVKQLTQVLLVPNTAIQKEKGSTKVKILTQQNKVEERAIKLGETDNINTQVISGLKAGEQLILATSDEIEIDKEGSMF